jgi:four helix bundle protein
MGVSRFEDLRVWQAAKEQCDRIGALIMRPEFGIDRRLWEQMNGACISVANNIAEGFSRGNDREFRQFLRYSFGSNAEVRACYHVASGRRYLESTEEAILIELNSRIARMIRRLIATLR